MEEINKGKRERTYKYGEGLFVFLGYLDAYVRNYRIIEGICRIFRKTIEGYPVSDHSTDHRRVKAKVSNDKIEGRMLIVDSTAQVKKNEYVE